MPSLLCEIWEGLKVSMSKFLLACPFWVLSSSSIGFYFLCFIEYCYSFCTKPRWNHFTSLSLSILNLNSRYIFWLTKSWNLHNAEAGKIDFDHCFTTPQFFPRIAKVFTSELFLQIIWLVKIMACLFKQFFPYSPAGEDS